VPIGKFPDRVQRYSVKALNFCRAARRLNITQPPLSPQIKLLEQELDATLLERTSRRVVLTPAGMIFLVEAQKLIEQGNTATTAAWRAAPGIGEDRICWSSNL
jgi:DNA-binding transcriptional LysR family regulator